MTTRAVRGPRPVLVHVASPPGLMTTALREAFGITAFALGLRSLQD
ncbi:hypothetical protein [Streptomyces niveus]